MLSPLHDDVDYIRSLPERLKDSGLHVPSFVCIETAIPGTPLFERLAQQRQPSFLPQASLHDFNAYSLVIQPAKASTEAFIGAYQQVLGEIYSAPQRLHKLADDLPRLLRRGSWMGAGLDVLTTLSASTSVAQGRTFIPSTDILPPERVPFTALDWQDEQKMLDILRPTAVTDAKGQVLPIWRQQQSPFAESKASRRIQTQS